MKKKLKDLLDFARSSLTFNLIVPILLAVLSMGILVGEAGILSHTFSFRKQHAISTYNIAETATMFVNGDHLEDYLEGRDMDEYRKTKENLSEYCKRIGVSIIYVITVDRSDYKTFTSIFDVLNNELDDSSYTEWEPGTVRPSSSEEFSDKYRRICEGKLEHSTIYQLEPDNGANPYITTLVPVKGSDGEITGIMCVQRPISELRDNLRPYMLGVIIITILLALITSFHTTRFIRKRFLIPLSRISEEAVRFAGNRSLAKPLGNVSPFKELSVLALSIDTMEKDIVDYMEDLTEVTAEKEKIKTELSLAAGIQMDMLPGSWPAFPERKDFDIYAVMNTAKEVGGDFYDFFLIDDDHLYLSIADVSGKGIPASLFMMASKIILSDHAVMGKSPSMIIRDSNNAICANNHEMMFVTAWAGILELSSGILRFVNAGHKPPVVRQGSGEYTLAETDSNLCLGVMEDMDYQEAEIRLEPGSVLFLFTDGLEDATSSDGKMFGTERVISVLNETKSDDPLRITEAVSEAVDVFVDGAEQFDDLTMLCISYHP